MFTQALVDKMIRQQREQRVVGSGQLTLGGLINKLKVLENKELLVFFSSFNQDFFPTCASSWRGSYGELALGYESTFQIRIKPLKLKYFIKRLKAILGKTLTGYKGGDYKMGKTTPIWVANYGDCDGFDVANSDYFQGVVDVSFTKEVVLIHTKQLSF